MDLDLKDVIPCPDCGYEGYEEDFAKGCPRCGADLQEPEDDDEGHDPPTRSTGPKRGARGRPGRGGARGKKAKGRPKGKPKAAPEPKKQLVLSEEFKARVFAALRRGNAEEAQELCLEVAGENEEHARQVYSYLLGIAKKKGWLGVDKDKPGSGPGGEPGLPPGLVLAGPGVQPGVGPAPGMQPPGMQPPGMLQPGMQPMMQPGMQAPMLQPGMLQPGMQPPMLQPGMLQPGMQPPMLQPGMLQPGMQPPMLQPGMLQPGMQPPMLQPGMLQPGMQPPMGGPPMPGQPLDALPMPAGILGGPPPPGQPLEPLGMPPGILGGMQPPGMQPPGMQPPGAIQAHAEMDLSASQMDLLPRAAVEMPAPKLQPGMRTGTRSAARPSPSSTLVRQPNAEPEEQGFLVRVAVEGRASQARLLCRAGRHAAAREMAQSTLARAGDAARAHAALGEALAGLGEEQAALAAYANAVRIDPDDPVSIRGYAQLLVRLGRNQEAVNAYHRIVQPGQGELRDAVALAATLRKVGNVQAAERVIEEVVKRDPQSLEPLRQAAEAKAGAGDMDGAGEVLSQLLQKESAPYTLALALAESILPRCGSSVRARVACAQVFAAVNRSFDAVRLTAPVVRHQPQDVTARHVLGLALAALGAGPQAEEHLRAAIQGGVQGPDRVEVFRALGEIYLARGDGALGIKALTHARDAAPQDVAARRALARALAAEGDLSGAIDELTRAHEQAGSDDNTLEDELDRLAARAFTKRVKEAEARLVADESDAGARLELAAALAQRGDILDAIRELERAAESGHTTGALDMAEEIAEDHADERALVEFRATLLSSIEDHTRAIEVLEPYLQEHSDDAVLRLQLLHQYSRGQRIQDAVVGLRAFFEEASRRDLEAGVALGEEILERERGYDALSLSLGRAKRRLGDMSGAAELLRAYLKSDPEDTEARVELARILESEGLYPEAYEVLEIFVREGSGSTSELERMATLALAAERLDDSVALFRRAVEREPDDISLQRALDATLTRQRRARLSELEAKADQDEAEKLELAGLYAGEGRKDDALALLKALGRIGENSELDLLNFSAEAFAKTDQTRRAESALRQVARILNFSVGSDQHLELLYRIAAMYEEAGGNNRASARRVFLELFARSPNFKDVTDRLENLSEDVRSITAANEVDERVLEVVHDGAPLTTVFDLLQGVDLSVDARLLAGYRTDTELQAVSPE